MYKTKEKRPVKLHNPRTGEMWICEDFSNRRIVDGVEFVEVSRPDNPRKAWMNLNTLVRSKK